MLQTTVTAADPYTAPPTQLPAILTGSFNGGQAVSNDNVLDRTPYAFLWCATARGFTTDVSQHCRESLDPYMVGLRENIEIQVNNGTPWQWRRLCFRTKRDMALVLGITSVDRFYTPQTNGSARRTVNTLGGNRNGGEQYGIYELLFQGQNATDWVDPMVAKIDTTRASIVSDKIKTLASGNEAGIIRKYKRWYPMHKRLVYNGDESGATMLSSDFSTRDSPGMGDFYILDLFRARYGSNASSILTFSPQATLYWHER